MFLRSPERLRERGSEGARDSTRDLAALSEQLGAEAELLRLHLAEERSILEAHSHRAAPRRGAARAAGRRCFAA